MTRRCFLGGVCMVLAGGCGARCKQATCPWQYGHFQVRQIYTGTAESFFLIFPDGTSMLMDCGDSSPSTFRVQEFGRKDLPVLPSADRRAGEWIARYVARVNPHGSDVDYMLLTHFHADHSGSPKFGRSGFLLAAETLRFKKAIDRGWPNYDDPLPYGTSPRWMSGSLELMKKTYALLSRRDGLAVEKFAVGKRDQVSLLHDPGAFLDFSVFNICGNGKVALKDGRIVNSRIGGGSRQGTNRRIVCDYTSSGDNEIPKTLEERKGMLYESCATTNDSWGYKPTDQNWKSPETIRRTREHLKAIGANYLLNVGPDGLGRIPAEAARILREANA